MKFLLGIYFLISVSAISQIQLPDHLLSKPSDLKAEYLNQKAKESNNVDSIILYNKEALNFAQKCDCDSLLITTHQLLAKSLYDIGNYEEALKEISIAEKLNETWNNPLIAFKYTSLKAGILVFTGKQREALKISEDALLFSKQVNDTSLIAEAYQNIGYMYDANGMQPEAKKYFETSLTFYNAINTAEKEKFSLYCYLRNTVANYEEFLNYDTLARNALDKSDVGNMAYLDITGSTLLIDKDFDPVRAKELALRGLKVCDSINYIPLKVIALYNIGYLENKSGNYNEAIRYLNQSMQLVEKSNHQSYFLLLNSLSESYEKKGDLATALAYRDSIITIKDSIFKTSSTKDFADFDARFKVAEKDKEIAQQQLEIARQKNTRNVWIFGSLALILVGIGIFQWRNNRQKRKKILIEAELAKEQEINEIRSKFLGNIAHEIRTPLTLISGNLNLALDHLKDPQKLKEHITTALQNSSKVTEDANEILALLKYEKDKTKIRLTPVLLNELLNRIVYSFSSLAQMKEIDLSFLNTIPESFKTEIDIEKLEKIINNLLSNAIKFSPSQSKISVAATLINSQLEVKVADQGEGIHYDEKEKIFERFYQSKNNSAVGGIGIGLSLSREFAKILGGHLGVTSKLGKGSAFTLQLPVTDYQGEVHAMGEKPKVKEKPVDTHDERVVKMKRKAKILITEDNPQMAKFLKDILASEYDCTLAFDGKEALELLQRECFDLITSDIMMPKMDGFELKKAVNEIPDYQYIPFILISAKTLEEDKLRGFALGIDDYIIKPFNKEELKARVKNLLHNYYTRNQWYIENKNLLSDTTSADKKLLKQVENTIIENLQNEDFTIKQLSESAYYSQRQLTRIIKQYTGMTPVQMLLEIRLQKAYQLLQHKTFFTLSEVRYDVGISSSSYFNKKFKERFGINPSELLG
ncbi:MAG: response regulator [Flavobacteriaceae bacterium]|nr:response regulator [Flavobacteriaceae bacterium]